MNLSARADLHWVNVNKVAPFARGLESCLNFLMFLTRRKTRGLSLLIVTLVAYAFIKTAFVGTRLLVVQPTVRPTKPGKQQWQEHAVNGATASQVFGKGSGKLGAENISTNPPLLNSNVTSVTKILHGFNTSCVENHLGLTEYASELCSKSSELCSVLSCSSLLSGNKVSQMIAQDVMSKQPHHAESDESFISATLDCQSFKEKRSYRVEPLTDEQTSFPVAFSLLVHKSTDQVEMLLRALYRPQNIYCIHIDAKSPKTFISAVRAIAGCFENVFVASKLEAVTWAGFSRLQADLNCMKDLIKHKTRWRYLLNVAGHAFPLKTVAEMVKILQLYNGANDIEGIDGSRVLRRRFEWEWLEANGTFRLTGRRNPKPPHEIDVIRGSAYGIFSREFVEFVLTDHRAADFLTWSKRTINPGDHYWATLHHTYSNPHLQTPGAFSG